MILYRHVTTFGVTQHRTLSRVTDLEIVEAGGRTLLIAANPLGGGISNYAIGDPDAAIELLRSRSYPDEFTYQGTPRLTALTMPGGGTVLHVAQMGGAADMSVSLRMDNGAMPRFAGLFTTSLGDDLTAIGQIETAQGQFIFSARDGDLTLTTQRMAADGSLVAVGRTTLPVPQGSTHAALDRVIPVMVEGQQILLAVSGNGNFISTHLMAANGWLGPGMVHQAGRGTGYDLPAQIGTVQVAGKTFVIMGAAGSDSLTVFQLTRDARLITVDHIIDEGTTRFQSVTALETVVVSGRAFVFVGGADDGISVFTLLPDGRLLHLTTIADTNDMTLSDVSSIAARVVDGKIMLFVGSSTETGITQLLFDPGLMGSTRIAPVSLMRGGAGSDLLVATAVTTRLEGGDGNDILVAGSRPITLVGGEGADIFVPSRVQGRIAILDYDPGTDRLDLSMLGTIRSIWQLRFVPTASGIMILYGETILDITTRSGRSLSIADFSNAMFPVAHYLLPELNPTLIPADPGPTGTPVWLFGTSGPDRLMGTARPELIAAGAGHDTVSGGAGHDTIRAEAGDDVVRGGEGDDQLFGGPGRDTLFGDAGNDLIHGDDGDDLIDGGAGDDSLYGGGGNDLIYGGPGNDRLSGGAGNDTLLGGPGNDRLFGEDGADLLNGGMDDDYLDGGAGPDILLGGMGHDTLLGGAGNDHVSGHAGNDLLMGGDGDDTLSGGLGNDTLRGDAGRDLLFGNQGNDLMSGDDGHDTLRGGWGDDTLYGDAGNDVLSGDQGNDLIYGGMGNDRIFGNAGNDRLYGEDGTDYLFDALGSNLLDGGAGDDTLLAGAGHDTLLGGDGNDRMNGGAGNDLLEGGTGNDTLLGGPGNDRMMGGEGHDLLTSFAGNNVMWGGAGNDTLLAGAGHDVLRGDAGNDLLNGGAGNDRIWGGPGHDRLLGGPGNDVLDGGMGNDVLDGGIGADRLFGGLGNDLLNGGMGHDILDGGPGADRLFGGPGNDLLRGGWGPDRLQGGPGNDTLIGGAGADVMFGGAGRDSFRFLGPGDSPRAQSDLIGDFRPGEDLMDLRPLNLSYAGHGPFQGPRSLRWDHVGQQTHVFVDLNGDRQADMMIRLQGHLTLDGEDFLL
ncbi:calcium-binding protein [Paracoccus nototheniae]|uniref:calcium-binding protein n=1 Tax=Paracoccus nototheniae TaxID=2489002 RepID=UPI00103BBB29|nr:calcium-binding protein [Paracoccus nototheniae]